MSDEQVPVAKPDYGLDAPGVVRNLLLIGAAGLGLAGAVALRWLPPRFQLSPLQGLTLEFPLLSLGLMPGIGLTLTGLYMAWSSRVGKIIRREQRLGQFNWTGAEQVLDVGCGRGLYLVGAARRLRTGRATGIDIWRAEDLSGNGMEATRTNARLEGVEDRVEVRTADMRELPFPEGYFDRVLSCAAIHNLDAAADRDAAIREIARVLKPGGQALIDDIRHCERYRSVFAAEGCGLVRRLDNRLESLFWTLLTFGSLRPGVILVRKSG